MRHKNGIERGLRITPPELLPHSGCGATQPPRPLQWGLRQEGIFGRFWYHNVSFRKENTGRERRCQVRVGEPRGRTLTGYCKFWAPRRQQSPLLNFYLLAGFSGGPELRNSQDELLTERYGVSSCTKAPVVLRPPRPLGAQGATSCPEAGGAAGGWAPSGQFMN